MPFPNYGESPSAENLFALADISARSLLNRIHHTLFFTDSLTIYTGHALDSVSSSRLPILDPNASLLRVCGELSRQLESWYESLPQTIKPVLDGSIEGDGQACFLRLRYWSSRQAIYRPFVVYVTSLHAEREGAGDVNVPASVLEMCERCLNACRMFILTVGTLLKKRSPYTYSGAQT